MLQDILLKLISYSDANERQAVRAEMMRRAIDDALIATAALHSHLSKEGNLPDNEKS